MLIRTMAGCHSRRPPVARLCPILRFNLKTKTPEVQWNHCGVPVASHPPFDHYYRGPFAICHDEINMADTHNSDGRN